MSKLVICQQGDLRTKGTYLELYELECVEGWEGCGCVVV